MDSKALTVSVTETPDGLFRAVCPQMPGLTAEGSTYLEAEQALMTLLESRTESGRIPSHAAVVLDPEAVDLTEE